MKGITAVIVDLNTAREDRKVIYREL